MSTMSSGVSLSFSNLPFSDVVTVRFVHLFCTDSTLALGNSESVVSTGAEIAFGYLFYELSSMPLSLFCPLILLALLPNG